MRSLAHGDGNGAGTNGNGHARSRLSPRGEGGGNRPEGLEGLRAKVARLSDLAIELLSEIEASEACVNGGAFVEPCGQLREEVERLEVKLITTALKEAGWNQAAAARRLGLNPNTLFYKIKSHGIDAMKPREP